MGLERAEIKPIYPKGEPVKVMFNPDEYTISKDINYAQSSVPGLKGPILQFVSGNLQTLEMELLLDSYEAHEGVEQHSDVRVQTGKIFKFLEIDRQTHAPPILQFTWGTLSFTCVLARVNQRFIMFLPDGTPVRARITATFNEYIDPEREAKEVDRQTADFSKVHIIMQGETLSQIAGKFYENAQLWRPIAIANGIDNPRALRTGQQLRIPNLPFTDPQSGEVMR
jgi:hypothetical protein